MPKYRFWGYTNWRGYGYRRHSQDTCYYDDEDLELFGPVPVETSEVEAVAAAAFLKESKDWGVYHEREGEPEREDGC